MSNHPRTSLRIAGAQTASPNATNGSQTITETPAGPSIPIGNLRLRAQPEERPRVQWAEDVVDNEGMGKKSSKVCCIYHKPQEPGESDSESSSSSDDDSDLEPDLSRAQKTTGKGRARKHQHYDDGEEGKGKGKEKNAEQVRMPMNDSQNQRVRAAVEHQPHHPRTNAHKPAISGGKVNEVSGSRR